MRKINLAITGCMGRMGQQIIKSARSDKNFKIVALTENRIINKKINGIKPSLNTQQAFKKADLIIDFTVPKCTFEVLKIASKLKKRVVIGTTGFTKKEENLIQKCLEISRQIMKNSPNAIAAAIKSINAGYNKDLNGYNEEIESFGNCFESDEFIEGTQAFLEKRRPNF